MQQTTIAVVVEFSGGMDLLFDGRKQIALDVPLGSTVADLIIHLRDNELRERSELFMQGQRPGILVLINDADWDLEGEGAYILQEKDIIVFISTLHGG